MGILSENISTFVPIREQYFVGCYINEISAIIGGPDSNLHYSKEQEICNQLCHWVVDVMMEWGCGLLQPEDLRPLLNTFMKNPSEYYIHIDSYGMDTMINVMSTHGQKHVMKIVLTAKHWVA